MTTYRISANKKFCSYYACGNNSFANPAVTFFAFPKKDDRCDAWIKAAGVPKHLADNRMYRFLCERHFPSIYICNSQRRTLLLGTAVPIPFNSCSSNETSEELGKSEMLEIVDEINEEMIDSEDLPEEFLDDKDSSNDQDTGDNMAMDENKSTLSVHNVETSNNMIELHSKPSTSRFDYTRKRKHVAAKMAEMKMKLLNTAGSPKTLNKETNIKTVQLDSNSVRLVPVQISENAQQQTLRLTPVVGVESASEEKQSNEVFRATLKSPVSSSTNAIEIIEQNDDTLTSKSSDEMVMEKDDKISEFIFKGEEYVQMPKEHYLKKIHKLKRSLAFYENIVRNMRDVLDQANPASSLDC